MFSFSDDTNIFLSHPDYNTLIKTFNKEIKHVSNWLKMNKLSLNIGKTNYMHFSTNRKTKINSNTDIYIDHTAVKQVDHTLFLGVLIDKKLNWKLHISKIANQISRSIGILKKLKYTLPSNILFSLYNTLILPHISYCNIVWAATVSKHQTLCPWTSTETTKLDRLFTLQKKALRICTHSQYLSHSKPLFHKLNTLNIFDINKLQTALFMFRYNNNDLPHTFREYFTKNNELHKYNTRNADKYITINHKRNSIRNSILHTGPILWNSLDKTLIDSININTFKFSYKATLINNYKSE